VRHLVMSVLAMRDWITIFLHWRRLDFKSRFILLYGLIAVGGMEPFEEFIHLILFLLYVFGFGGVGGFFPTTFGGDEIGAEFGAAFVDGNGVADYLCGGLG
jgi:hypothetical protein